MQQPVVVFSLAVVTLLAGGCGPNQVAANTSEMGTTTTGADTGETTETGASSVTNGGLFPDPDIAAPPVPCDPFMQDCPEGEKCVPYSSNGGKLDANKCVPINGTGQAGDPCTYAGAAEATDDCGPDSYCWYTTEVDGQLMGICTPFCQGSADVPMCPMGTQCDIHDDGSLALCLTSCDPLLQDCAEGLACYWANTGFSCLLTTQDIPEGQPCGAVDDCAGGLICIDASVLPDCMGAACCTGFCALDDMTACPDPALACVAFFEVGMAPTGYDNVGICIAPAP